MPIRLILSVLLAGVLASAATNAQEMSEADAVAYIKKRDPSAYILPTDGKDVSDLSLQGSVITDDDMTVVARLPKLKIIRFLDSKSVGGSKIGALRKLPNLEIVDFDGCTGLDDAGLAEVAKFKKLRVLGLEKCPNITGRGIRELASAGSLQYLRFRAEEFLKAEDIRAIGALRQLRELEADGYSNPNFGDEAVTGWTGMESLEELRLWGGRISSKSIRALAKLPKLKKFEVHNHHMADLRDDDLIPFVEYKHLGYLSVNGDITDAGMKHIANVEGLKRFYIGRSEVTPFGLAELVVNKSPKEVWYQRAPNRLKREEVEAVQKLRDDWKFSEIFK